MNAIIPTARPDSFNKPAMAVKTHSVAARMMCHQSDTVNNLKTLFETPDERYKNGIFLAIQNRCKLLHIAKKPEPSGQWRLQTVNEKGAYSALVRIGLKDHS